MIVVSLLVRQSCNALFEFFSIQFLHLRQQTIISEKQWTEGIWQNTNVQMYAHFRWLLVASGTVCRATSLQLQRSMFSGNVSKLTFFAFIFSQLISVSAVSYTVHSGLAVLNIMPF